MDAARWRELLAGPIPELVPVRQRFDASAEADPAAAVRRELARPEIRRWLEPGHRVALAVGSRGLAALVPMVRAAVGSLRDAGCEVTIVPAMGSHGGATPEGQTRLLADYGITEPAVGAPVAAGTEVREVGRLANGMPVYASEVALAHDLVVPLNRVKPHTSFRGEIESGLAKMLVIGLGKHPGAQAIHARGWDAFAANLHEAVPIVLAAYPFRFGIATVENAVKGVVRVEAVSAEALSEREPQLLVLARSRMARLPFDAVDVLAVVEAGKNLSGLGMDPNVTGRYASSIAGGLRAVRVALFGLTAETEGNAIGAGLADVVTQRLADAMDPGTTYLNAVTSTSLAAAKLPIVMPDDRTALRLALQTCGAPAEAATVALIRSTSALERFWASPTLVEGCTALEPLGPARPVVFDVDDRLVWRPPGAATAVEETG